MHVPSSKPTWGWWAGVALGVWVAGQNTALAAGPLAELPEPGGYTSWIRIIIVLLMMVPWLLFCQWVDKDTLFVRRVNQTMWNGIVLAGGAAGLIAWLFLPWQTPGLFAAGFGLWFIITGTSCAMYVVVRNGVVDPSARVFTPKHIKTWFSNIGKKQAERHVVEERVKLVACDGRKVPVPDDPAKAEPYEAAQILLHDALWRRATEAELVVTAKAVKLAYRIDGVGTPRSELIDKENAERALLFIKQIAGLDITERRKPQTGEIRASIGGDRGMTEIDVQTSGTTQHERLSLKIVGEETKLRLNDLGLTPSDLEKFDSQVRQPGGGLFLISGPAGSGVTTTLYAALRSHDAFMQNLLTLEREPLMELENITQNIYDSTKHEGSYARQLQTVLRREPDVVMVSDCLDRETAHLAAKAAKDGKRIYLGIQAKDSFDALKKLVSLAGDTDTVASVIKAVTSQRLIRKLCIACRVAYKPDQQLLQKANLPVGKIQQFFRQPKPEELVDEKGNPRMCANCQNSAYFGRTGLFEVLTIDDTMRDLISRGQSINELRAQARKNGMLYLQEVGLQKVIEGITGMNEMLRVMRDEDTPAPAAAASKVGNNPPAAPAAPKKGA